MFQFHYLSSFHVNIFYRVLILLGSASLQNVIEYLLITPGKLLAIVVDLNAVCDQM